MNHVEMFKRFQRLQGGEEDVPLAGRVARKVQDLSIEALQNLPEWLKSPIRHGVGRVATNVIDPFGYEAELKTPRHLSPGVIPSSDQHSKLEETAGLFSPRNLPHTLSSILHDRPAFAFTDPNDPTTDPEIDIASQKARRPLFREYFDLPTQDEDNVYTHQGKNYRINPETKNSTAQFVLNQFRGPMYRKAEYVHDPAGDFMIGAEQPGSVKTNMLSRNYFPEQPDPWDFAPHPGELAQTKGRPLGSDLYGRLLLEAIGKPATLETGGYANPPPKEDVNAAQNTGGGLQRGTGSVQHLAEGTSNLPYDPSYPGPTNPHESGSGYWTQRLVGTGVGTASNFFVPGLGLLTGPIASWAMRAMQSGMSQNAVQNAVKAYQTSQTGVGQGGDTTTAPATDTSSNATAPTTSTTPSAGIGIDPFGNPADPGEFWSNDFGRWGEGDQYGTTPGNYNPSGPGGGYGTRGVWGGQTTIPIASDPNFTPSLGWAMPAASGGGAYGGNTMAKIALHSGTFRDAATPEQWAFMQNYLSGGGGGGGGGQGVGGAGRPMTQSQQMGTSSVNPGLKLFHAIQKRKKTT